MLKKFFVVCFLLFIPYLTIASDERVLLPEEIVRAFYHDYLIAEEMSDLESANEFSLKAIFEYTTEHLRSLRDNDESDADYFVDAQDICEEWKNSIDTKVVSVNDHHALVNLKLGYGKGVSFYDISLVKINSKWLIDSIKCVSKGSIYCPRQAETEK